MSGEVNREGLLVAVYISTAGISRVAICNQGEDVTYHIMVLSIGILYSSGKDNSPLENKLLCHHVVLGFFHPCMGLHRLD